MKKKILACMVVVLVSCITVMAGKPGEGLDIGKVTVRPYVDVSVTDDSNPYLANSNVISDTFFEYELGAELSYRARNLHVYGRIYAFSRNYSDDAVYENDRQYDDSLEFSGFGESLGLTYGEREKLQIRARQSYQQVTDYSKEPYNAAFVGDYRESNVLSEDRGDRTDRDLINSYIGLGRDLTDKTELDIGYQFAQVNYVDDVLFDSDRSTVNGEYAYKITDKSAAFIVGKYGIEENSDELLDYLESKIIRVGWKTLLTDKTIFKGSIGMEFYDINVDASSVDPDRLKVIESVNTDQPVEFDSKDEWVSFDLAWIWMPIDKLTFNTLGGNATSASSYEVLNVRKATFIGSSATFQFTDAFKGWLGIAYRQDEYSRETLHYDDVEKLNYLIARKSDFINGEMGVEFAPPEKWYSVYATATYEDTDSNIDNEDFDQVRLTLGGKLIY